MGLWGCQQEWPKDQSKHRSSDWQNHSVWISVTPGISHHTDRPTIIRNFTQHVNSFRYLEIHLQPVTSGKTMKIQNCQNQRLKGEYNYFPGWGFWLQYLIYKPLGWSYVCTSSEGSISCTRPVWRNGSPHPFFFYFSHPSSNEFQLFLRINWFFEIYNTFTPHTHFPNPSSPSTIIVYFG